MGKELIGTYGVPGLRLQPTSDTLLGVHAAEDQVER